MTVPVILIPLTGETTAAACADWALVLDSIGIPYERRTTATGTSLWVAPEHHARAARELRHYQSENRGPPPAPVIWPSHPHAAYGLIGYALVLVAVMLAALVRAGGEGWVTAGVLDAGFLERGEWWRVLTALTLHADVPHLLSNLVFGALFGYPAARLFGPGLGWFLILAGGALGNVLDALVHPPEHSMLGASTAVFAALGLVAAYGWRRHLRSWSPWMRRSAPLVAGIALLAFTGTGGENTDIAAHLFGFAVGVAIGALCTVLPLPRPGRSGAQWAAGLATISLIATAWALALAAS